jgi:hypothetical protein
VDPAQRTFTTWWGFGFPWWRTLNAVPPGQEVTITAEVRRLMFSRQSPYGVFAVRIGGVEVVAPRSYERARRAAELTANALGLGIRDGSLGAWFHREPGGVDEPFRQRLLRHRAHVPPVPATGPGRIEVSAVGEEIVCRMPRDWIQNALRHLAFILLLPGAVFMSLGLLTPGPPVVPALVLGGLCVTATAWLAFWAWVPRSRVRYSPEGVSHRAPVGLWRTIETQELEDLFCVPSRRTTLGGHTGAAIVLRSDTRTITIDAMLSAEEQAWLYASICHALMR